MDTILENMLRIMEEKNISQKKLCEKLGITRAIFTGWKNGRYVSYRVHLTEIADILGVEQVELLGGVKSEEEIVLTQHEKDWIKLYRTLRPKHQEKIDQLILKYSINILESENK